MSTYYILHMCIGVYGTQHLSMDALGLHVFPMTLTGNAALWFSKHPQRVITSWVELQHTFLTRFFIRPNRFKLRDRIISFQQFPGDSLMSTWERYKECLRNAQDHGIYNSTLVLSFYQALNTDNQAHADALMGGSVLGKPFTEVDEQFDKLPEIQHVYKPIHEQPTKYREASDRNSDHVKINTKIFEMLDQNRENLEMLTKQIQDLNTLESSRESHHVKNVINEEENERINLFMLPYHQYKGDGVLELRICCPIAKKSRCTRGDNKGDQV